MSSDYEIANIHLTPDGEHIAFVVEYGGKSKMAHISHEALTVLNGPTAMDMRQIFENQRDRIGHAAWQLALLRPDEDILLIESSNFQSRAAEQAADDFS